MSIYLFCRPIRSGKTTELMHWCNQQQSVGGLLMPDINGSRKILNIASKEVFDIECTQPHHSNEPLTTVGRFYLYTAAFDKANEILINTINQNPRWLVIDEAGILELQAKGFYTAIQLAVEHYQNNTFGGKLLITVRESLCEKIISFFNIRHFKIIQQLENI
jgi:nucleoside-triphosphatase THEP1